MGASALKTIDYVYRFDPNNPTCKSVPADADMARSVLEDGNRMFARWMANCHANEPGSNGDVATGGDSDYVIQCNGLELGMRRAQGEIPRQVAFAVTIGCSDARVPTEMIFGQGLNDLFVIRVAGNVLDDSCLGSIDYAVNVLSDSVRVVVVLGHSGCGAVTAAVDAYLRPLKYWSKTTSTTLRSILQKLFVPVRDAANAIKEVWGPDARQMPGYREALIESAVCLNAAQSAFTIRQEIELAGRWDVDVLFGVYNLFNHQVCMPNNPDAPCSDDNVRLAQALTNPRGFHTLALTMAEMLKPAPAASGDGEPGHPTGSNHTAAIAPEPLNGA